MKPLIRCPKRYGNGSRNLLPNWVDIVVVIVFALAIFYWAVRLTLTKQATAAAVASLLRSSDPSCFFAP